jgi:glycosyltransferase involved in cell wall biosynthesis
MTRVLVVNMGSPETDRLAVELAARGALAGLVKRYANQGRWWERSLGRLPAIGPLYVSTLGRRVPPAGLGTDHLREAGVWLDFAFAISGRIQRRFSGHTGRLANHLLQQTQMAVARHAARCVDDADMVVANYHVALPAFQRARLLGRRTVLNYPIAHHRWQYREFEEQARRNPQFAAALPKFGNKEAHSALLDEEIELADRILVGSGFVRDTFVEEGVPSHKLRVVPYGADASRFHANSEDRLGRAGFRVLFSGQIGERKGVSFLLAAYEKFRKPDTELHLVGDFVADRAVYARFEGLYHHTPNVPQAALPALMHAADVFVLPTLVEGMPMVVIEAMACGLPVIATPRGPDEVVRDGVDGFVVRPCDTEAIVQKLQQLYDDRSLLRRMSEDAARNGATWTWSRYAQSAADHVLAD